MAQVSDGDSGLNVELNIVPFIDLLSSLVLFLLVTAVWLQIGAIPASVDSKGKAPVSFTPQTKLTVHLTSMGYRLTWPTGKGNLPTMLQKSSGGFDTSKLTEVLSAALNLKKFASLAVSADDNVEYGAVAQAIDAAKSSGVPLVALSTE